MLRLSALYEGDNNSYQSILWMIKSAEAGYIEAQKEIAHTYSGNFGDTTEAYELSMKWYERAALSNDPEAQYYIALTCMYGKPQHEDAITAFAWLSISDSNGFSKAQDFLDQVTKKLNKDQIKEGEALKAILSSKIVNS